MITKKECVAMLLAGGQGSRLFALTQKKAKPAVPYGGKYKIIDFPLSNCANSGIDTVGVLTQYEPLELNSYIGTGGFWDLDNMNGGAFVLPPYVRGEQGNWYRGTADAIYQNINFIDNYDPDHIIVLSGDQICCMDYQKMLNYHKKKGADCTISVLEVTLEEAKRFGIMNTDEDNRIEEFEEKPAHPKSTKASMGIYVFKWKLIRQYLIDNNFIDCVIQLPSNLFFGTSIATCIMVLKKNKADSKTLFIDASGECVKVTNNNKLTPENIDRIVDTFAGHAEVAHFSHLAAYEEIREQEYNLSVSTYVEQEDTREVIDITALNAEIEKIVAREQVLRAEIDKIIGEIEA